MTGCELRLGISRSGAGLVHALISKNAKGRCTLLGYGTGLPIGARLLVPGLVCGDLEQTPVYLFSEALGEKKPDQWIDSNEEKIIPKGLSSDSIVNEYSTHGDQIYSVTVSKKARDAAIQSPLPGVELLSLTSPLWNISKLFSKLPQPYILWKIWHSGSVLGLVDDGRLMRVVNCWVGSGDIGSDPAGSGETVSQYIGMLAGNEESMNIAAFSTEEKFGFSEEFSLPGHSLIGLPTIPGLPSWCYDAYANACFGSDGEMDFLPSETNRAARKTLHTNARMSKSLRIGIWAILFSLVLLGGVDLSFRAVDRKFHKPMELLQAQEMTIKAAEKKKAVLMTKLSDKARFAVDRSRVTGLLTEMQTAFPENAWAEGISITGTDENSYKVEILALSHESGLITEVLQRVRRIKSVTNPRLAYSEQAVLPDRSKVIKFKITFDWRSE